MHKYIYTGAWGLANKIGDYKKAETYYKKSLELNPKNSNAKAVLENINSTD